MSAADPTRTAALRTIRGQFPVLAYYSHTKRTTLETAEDDKYGIDRRAFSNLHVEEFFVPSLPQHLVLHSLTNNTNGPSVEHFFQAMKCVKCCDALLLLQVVQDPKVVANLARGHFPMSHALRVYYDNVADEPVAFEELDITQGVQALEGPEKMQLKNVLKNLAEFYDNGASDELLWASPGTHVYVHRPEMRPEWPEIAKEVMFWLNVAKFMGGHPQCAARQTMLNCVKHGVLHFAEHTENDGIYGDSGDGTGLNQLGKVHNTIAACIAEGTAPEWIEEMEASMNKPVNELYCYEAADAL